MFFVTTNNEKQAEKRTSKRVALRREPQKTILLL